MSNIGFWRGTAIVTAAGSEVGGALIDRFAAEGMAIAIDEDTSRAEEKACAVRNKGGSAIGIGINALNQTALREAAIIASQQFIFDS